MKIRTYIKTENPTLWQGFCQIKSELLHLNDQAITGLHADSWFFYKSMWPQLAQIEQVFESHAG